MAREREEKFTLQKCRVKSRGPTQSFSLPPSLAAAPFSGLLTVSAAAVLHQAQKAVAPGAADSLQPGALSPAHWGLCSSLSCSAVPLGSHLLIRTLRLAWL